MNHWRTWWSGWQPELWAGVLLVLLAAGYYLQRHPLRLPASAEPEAAALPPASRLLPGDVALILSADRPAPASTAPFATRDWSAWWSNVLEQEVGPHALLYAQTVAPAELSSRRLVVIAASAGPHLGVAQRTALQQLMARGGCVVVEGEDRLGLSGAGPVLIPATTLPALVRAQQGWHGENLVLPVAEPVRGLAPGRIMTTALRPPEVPAMALEPRADREERALWQQLLQGQPFPRWWYFPGGAAGVVVPSYDEEGFGDRADWQPRFLADPWGTEGRPPLDATLFAIPTNLTPTGATRLLELGVDLQLHWNRGFFDQHVDERVGWGPFRPAVRDRSLQAQQARVAELRGSTAPTLNRNHGLVWDPAWGRTFRMLAGAGLRADSSYGPSGPGQAGYLFGTGLPFRPLDDTGWPLTLYELPFLLQDDEEYSPELQRELLERSQAGDHQLLTFVYHSNTLARVPTWSRLTGWLALPQDATATEHRIWNLSKFLDFWEGRARSPLHSWFADGRLRVEAVAAVPELSLRLPLELPDGRRLVEVLVEREEFPLDRGGRRADSLLVPLPVGLQRVEAAYR